MVNILNKISFSQFWVTFFILFALYLNIEGQPNQSNDMFNKCSHSSGKEYFMLSNSFPIIILYRLNFVEKKQLIEFCKPSLFT